MRSHPKKRQVVQPDAAPRETPHIHYKGNAECHIKFPRTVDPQVSGQQVLSCCTETSFSPPPPPQSSSPRPSARPCARRRQEPNSGHRITFSQTRSRCLTVLNTIRSYNKKSAQPNNKFSPLEIGMPVSYKLSMLKAYT